MLERIEITPRVCAGKPVIAGTRISAAVILGQRADGESILESYPEFSREDIQAALHYAKAAIEHTEIAASVADWTEFTGSRRRMNGHSK